MTLRLQFQRLVRRVARLLSRGRDANHHSGRDRVNAPPTRRYRVGRVIIESSVAHRCLDASFGRDMWLVASRHSGAYEFTGGNLTASLVTWGTPLSDLALRTASDFLETMNQRVAAGNSSIAAAIDRARTVSDEPHSWLQDASFAVVAVSRVGLAWVTRGESRVYLGRRGQLRCLDAREPHPPGGVAPSELEQRVPLQRGDQIVLCGASVHERCSHAELEACLQSDGPSPWSTLVTRLVDRGASSDRREMTIVALAVTEQSIRELLDGPLR